jgi:TrmH family RNA methyltransferase
MAPSPSRRNEREPMRAPLITSRANPLIKRIRALEQRKHRDEQGAFFVEGIQPVREGIARGAAVETIIVAPALLTSATALSIVEQQRAAATPIAEVSRAVFESIAEREHPSGLAAIVRTARRALNELSVAPDSIFVALYGVSNPGNLGTIIRTMDAVGGSGVILIGDTTDPYHPTAVKASRGALFSVPLALAKNVEELRMWCQTNRVHIVTTVSDSPKSFWSKDYALPLVAMFGGEGAGLPEDLLTMGTAVRIPMSGSGDSLNLAVAASVMLYEIKRQVDMAL